MAIGFEDVSAENIREGANQEYRITLLRGAQIDCAASSTPTAYAPRNNEKLQGVRINGYVVEKDNKSLGLVFQSGHEEHQQHLGGLRVYKDAIHSIERLVPAD